MGELTRSPDVAVGLTVARLGAQAERNELGDSL